MEGLFFPVLLWKVSFPLLLWKVSNSPPSLMEGEYCPLTSTFRSRWEPPLAARVRGMYRVRRETSGLKKTQESEVLHPGGISLY